MRPCWLVLLLLAVSCLTAGVVEHAQRTAADLTASAATMTGNAGNTIATAVSSRDEPSL